jgi:hypothetical protein
MAVRLDSSSDYLERTANLPQTNAFSVSLWAYLSVDTNAYACPMYFADFNESAELWLATTSDGTSLLVDDSTGSLLTLGSLTEGSWHWLAFRRTAIDYLEGYKQEYGGSIVSDSFSSTMEDFDNTQWTSLMFGNDIYNSAWNGRLAAIKFWAGGLSEEELFAERDQYLPRRMTDLYGFWPALAGSGERVRDYGPSGYDLTENGTVVDEAGPPIRWGTERTAGGIYIAAAAPSNLTVSVSDGLTVGESSSAITSDPQISESENFNVGESSDVDVVAGVTDLAVSVSDGLALDEAISSVASDPEIGVHSIAYVNNEEGDLSDWDTTSATGGGSISASTDADYAGTWGTLMTAAGSGSQVYGRVDSAPNAINWHRFYFSISALTMADGDQFWFWTTNQGASAMEMQIRRNGANYQITADGSSWTTFSQAGWHNITVTWDALSGDGWYNATIDGTTLRNDTGLNNPTMTLEYIQVGPYSAVDAGTTGDIYVDELYWSDRSQRREFVNVGESTSAEVTLDVSVSDGLTLAEATARELTITASISENLNVSETTAVPEVGISTSHADGTTLAEYIEAALSDMVIGTVDAVWVVDDAGERLRFYGNGVSQIDRVRIPLDVDSTSTAIDVGASDFTYECWLNCDYDDNTSVSISDARESNIFMDRDIYNHERGWVAGVTRVSSELRACFGLAGAGASWDTIIGTTEIGDNEWHHVAIDRNSTTGLIRLFVDGNLEGSDTYTTGDLSYPDGYDPGQGQDNEYLVLGAEKHDEGGAYPSYNGYMDELRISDNRRYTGGSFTPPTRPFGNDANAVGIYHFNTGSGTVLRDSSNVSGAPTNGELLVGGTPTGPEWGESTLEFDFVSVALGQPLAISVSDGLNVGEAQALLLENLVSQSENLNIGEASALALDDLVVSESDGVSAAEASSVLSVLNVSVSDGISLGDTNSQALADLAIAEADSLNIGESSDVDVIDLGVTLSIAVTPDDYAYWKTGVRIT